MKHPYESFFPFLLLALFCLLCVNHVHAAAFPDVIPAGQAVPSPVPLNSYSSQSVYYVPRADGSFQAKIGVPPSFAFTEGVPGLTVTPSPAATTSNPYGYVPKVVNGAAVMESVTTLKLAPPPGAVPSVSTAAAAAQIAGGTAADVGTITKSIALGSGAGSLAVSLGKTALGVGAVGAAVFGSPVTLGVLTAASVGMAGYDLWQRLQAEGVQVPPDGGTVMYQPPGGGGGTPIAGTCSTGYQLTGSPSSWQYAPADVCVGQNGNGNQSAVFEAPMSCRVTWLNQSVSFVPIICRSGITVSCPAGSTPISGTATCTGAPPPATAITNEQMMAAITAASLAAAAAADMVRFALDRGYPLPYSTPEPDGFLPSIIESPFAEVESVTDSIGNTVKTLERNRLSITAPSGGGSGGSGGSGGGGVSPVLEATKQSVKVTNAAPTSVSSTSLAPVIAENIASAAATAGNMKLSDLCVQHPDILACADISQLGDLPAVTPLTSEKNIGSLTPVQLGVGMAVCPPPLALPGMFGGPVMYLDIWKYPCQFADKIKPINIAVAGMASIFILMGAFRNG